MDICEKLSLYYNVPVEPGETLLFLMKYKCVYQLFLLCIRK